MTETGIVTENISDLPADIVSRKRISLVPVGMHWPEIQGLPGENTFRKMRELEKKGIKSFGKTSQPSPQDYLASFQYCLKAFKEVVCVCVSSRLSGCFSSANLAVKLLGEADRKRVQVVDSLNATCGHALIVLHAAEQAEAGITAERLKNELSSFVSSVKMFAMLHDPKWVEAHGRLPHAVGGAIRALSRIGVRPVLEMKHGTLTMSSLKTRARDKARALFRQVLKTASENPGKNYRVAVTHGDDAASALRLSSMIETEVDNAEVVFTGIMNDVIGVPAGPDTLAVALCPS
jgi:DegV family protein with EDD domain